MEFKVVEAVPELRFGPGRTSKYAPILDALKANPGKAVRIAMNGQKSSIEPGLRSYADRLGLKLHTRRVVQENALYVSIRK